MLLFSTGTALVGERDPITPLTRGLSPFTDEVVVRVPLELLRVPIGAVVVLVKRENEPRVVLGGKPDNKGSLVNLLVVVCGVVGRPLPIEPTPFSPPLELENAVVSDFASVPQMEGDGGGGLALNPVLLWFDMIKSSVGDGIRS